MVTARSCIGYRIDAITYSVPSPTWKSSRTFATGTLLSESVGQRPAISKFTTLSPRSYTPTRSFQNLASWDRGHSVPVAIQRRDSLVGNNVHWRLRWAWTENSDTSGCGDTKQLLQYSCLHCFLPFRRLFWKWGWRSWPERNGTLQASSESSCYSVKPVDLPSNRSHTLDLADDSAGVLELMRVWADAGHVQTFREPVLFYGDVEDVPLPVSTDYGSMWFISDAYWWSCPHAPSGIIDQGAPYVFTVTAIAGRLIPTWLVLSRIRIWTSCWWEALGLGRLW